MTKGAADRTPRSLWQTWEMSGLPAAPGNIWISVIFWIKKLFVCAICICPREQGGDLCVKFVCYRESFSKCYAFNKTMLYCCMCLLTYLGRFVCLSQIGLTISQLWSVSTTMGNCHRPKHNRQTIRQIFPPKL